MKKYARIEDGVVAEIIFLPDDLLIGRDIFTETFAERLHLCTAEVDVGWLYASGDFISPEKDDGESLEQLKERLRAAIDFQAEVQRSKYITLGSGQALTYQAKIRELEKFDADESPLASRYPMLSAEIGVSGETLHAVAESVRSAYSRWLSIGSAIEEVRLRGKYGVTHASSKEAAASASSLEWP